MNSRMLLLFLLLGSVAGDFDQWYNGYTGSWPTSHTYQNFNPVTGSLLLKCPESTFKKIVFDQTVLDLRLFDALNSDTSASAYRYKVIMKVKTSGEVTFSTDSKDSSYGFSSSSTETISTTEEWLQMRLDVSSLSIQYGPETRVMLRDVNVAAVFDIGSRYACSTRVTTHDGDWVEVLAGSQDLEVTKTLPNLNFQEEDIQIKWYPDSVGDTLEVALSGSGDETITLILTSTEFQLKTSCGTTSQPYSGSTFVLTRNTGLVLYDTQESLIRADLVCSSSLLSSDSLSVQLTTRASRRTNLVGQVSYMYSTKSFCPKPTSTLLSGSSWDAIPTLSRVEVICSDARYQPVMSHVNCTWKGEWEPSEPECTLKNCTGGRELEDDGECHLCQPGSYLNTSKGVCEVCPHGSFSITKGATQCTECNPLDSVVDASGTLCIQTGVPRTQKAVKNTIQKGGTYLYTLLGLGAFHLVIGLAFLTWQYYQGMSEIGTFQERWKRYNEQGLFPRNKISQQYIYPEGLVEATCGPPPSGPPPSSPPPKPPSTSSTTTDKEVEGVYDKLGEKSEQEVLPTIAPSYSEDNYMKLNLDAGESFDNYMRMEDKRASYADVTIDSKGITRVQPRGTSSIYTKAALHEKEEEVEKEWWEEADEETPPVLREYILSDNGDTSL